MTRIYFPIIYPYDGSIVMLFAFWTVRQLVTRIAVVDARSENRLTRRLQVVLMSSAIYRS